MIYRGGSVLGEVEFLVEIDREDSFHPIVRKSLTELISDNEENLFGIFEFHILEGHDTGGGVVVGDVISVCAGP